MFIHYLYDLNGRKSENFTPQWMDLSCAGDNAVPRYAVCEKIVEG